MFVNCNLNDLYIFSTLVDLKGFTAAAKALNIPKSRISRRIAALEADLDARLIQRSTRSIGLTEAGHALYQHCQTMIEAARAGEDAVRNKHDTPTGLVRLSVPIAVGHFVVSQIIPEFLEAFPEVRIEVNVSNRRVDMIAEGFDLVLRGIDEPISDSSLVQVSICKLDWLFVASSRFIDRHGFPDNPEDLKPEHYLLYSRQQQQPNQISMFNPDHESYPVKVSPPLVSNSFLMLKAGAMGGLGVAGLPPYMCTDELAGGDLHVVLPSWTPRWGEIVALFPTRRGLAPATRALLDYVKRELPGRALTPVKSNRKR